LIFYKIQNPEFSLKAILLIGSFLIIVASILFFGFDIYKKYSEVKEDKSDELPKSLSKEELKVKIKELVESQEYQNHIKSWGEVKSYTVNKNLIYSFDIEPLYIDNNRERLTIVINSHFPENHPAVLFNANSKDVYKAVNSASTNPEPPSMIEKTEMFNPMTQVAMRTERRTPSNKKIKKKAIGDLE
jgi:hypothetical protein